MLSSRERAVPAWPSPARSSARRVALTPFWPRSTEWLEATVHASKPVHAIAGASAAGALKIG